MSTERDELASIIMSPESFDGGPASCGPNDVYAARTADAILAAGYRKPEKVELTGEHIDDLVNMLRSSSSLPGRVNLPREAVNMLLDRLQPQQVTTVEELDALPVHSVISEAIGYVWQKMESGHWVSWLNPGENSTWLTSGRRGPFTVLRVGGAE